jgi:hypothetical protein
MKLFNTIGAAAAVAAAGMAGAATLNLQLGPAGSSHDPDGGSFGVGNVRGGVFQITINSVSGLAPNQVGGDIVVGNSFLSFCIEVTETVNPPANYQFNVSTASVSGGASPLNPQPLVSQTAFLYSQFRAGTLASVIGSFNASANGDINALQDAIWYFQNQLGADDVLDNGAVYGNLSGKAQDLVDAANDALVTNAWTGIGNVRVLNLGVNGVNQDQLALVPMIPLPQGAGLAAAGLVAIGARRRRAL